MANNDDYTTGRPAKDDQMRAVRKVQGEPKRQATLPPHVSDKALEAPLPKGEED